MCFLKEKKKRGEEKQKTPFTQRIEKKELRKRKKRREEIAVYKK